jgi:hypothetical protein
MNAFNVHVNDDYGIWSVKTRATHNPNNPI